MKILKNIQHRWDLKIRNWMASWTLLWTICSHSTQYSVSVSAMWLLIPSCSVFVNAMWLTHSQLQCLLCDWLILSTLFIGQFCQVTLRLEGCPNVSSLVYVSNYVPESSMQFILTWDIEFQTIQWRCDWFKIGRMGNKIKQQVILFICS